MNKSKRTVTVDNSSCQEEEKPSRRQSVFDRLGPGAMPSSKERHVERQEQCRNWLRNGECVYGSHCKYLHKALKSSKSSRERHESPEYKRKGKAKREDYSRSPSPVTFKSRRDKPSTFSHKSKLDYETKLRSTIVKPNSPGDGERSEKIPARDLEKGYHRSKKEVLKKPLEQQWEEDEQEDSDDWDAARLDYKEELTLEMKRQQLQRELELELQKEEFEKNNASDDIESVFISKQVRSSSSSSSSSSRSSSASSSSITSSSSSSSSDSGSDSDSSASSSDSGPNAEKFSKIRHKKVQSKSIQHGNKYKSSHYAAGRNSPSKSDSKKNSKGPRTPSPIKSNRNRNDVFVQEPSDYSRKEKRQKGKQRMDDIEKRKRYSVSPPISPRSSDMVNFSKDRRGWKNEGKKSTKKFIEAHSPPRIYNKSISKKDRFDKSQSGVSSATHKRSEHSSHQSPNSRGSSRTELDSYRKGRSPHGHANRKDSRQISLSPKRSYSVEKSKYSSDKVRSSISPLNEDRPKSYRERRSSREPKERLSTAVRDEIRPREQYSPSRSRTADAKGGRYPSYYEDESRRRPHSPQSPNRHSRRDYHPEHDSSIPSRERLPPHPDSDILPHERHKEKLSGTVYGDESSRGRQMYEAGDYGNRHGRNYRESEYPPRGEIHGRDYLPDPIRDRELPYRNIDNRREYADLPRERDYGRPEYRERDYYQDSAAYGHRDSVGRSYSSRVPDERRRDPLYDISERERHHDRYLDMRVDERDRYPHPLPGEELDRGSRRRGRPGQYIPEGELRGKHDWPPRHADYPDLPPADRYGYHHLDYAMEPAHGWEERPRDIERDRDHYYGGRRHSRLEPDERGSKQRRDGSAYSGAAWEMSDCQSKRDYPPNERDYLIPREPLREREREPHTDSGRDRRKDGDRERDIKAESSSWPERKGRKRERSISPDQLSEHAEKRLRDSHYGRKPELPESAKSEKRDRIREPPSSEIGIESRNKNERKPIDGDCKTEHGIEHESRRSTYKKSNQRPSSRDGVRGSLDRRDEKSTLESNPNSSKRSHSVEGSVKDDSSEKGNRDTSSEKKSRRHNDSRERHYEERDRKKSPEDRERHRKSGIKERSFRGTSVEKRQVKEDDSKVKIIDDNEKTPSTETDLKLTERKKSKRTYKPNVEDEGVEEPAKKPKFHEDATLTNDLDSDAESNVDAKSDENVTLSKNEKLSSNNEKIDTSKIVDELKNLNESIKEEVSMFVDPVSPGGGSLKSASLIPDKTVVVDEVLSSELAEEKIVESSKGSEVEDNKDNEEDLSEWSDGDDELLTRDEIVEQNGEEQETKEPGAKADIVSKPRDTLYQKTKRIEEIKADHSMRTLRSSSSDRQRRDRSNRSLSSERSRGSREGSRERYRSRDRRRIDRSWNDKECSSRSGSRNTSLDRSRVDSSNRSHTGESGSKEKEEISISNDGKKRDEDPTPNTDNFDYDPISDDELEAMIEEPGVSETSETSAVVAKKPGIVDALNVDWASLMGSNERTVAKPTKVKATQQFKPGKIFSRIGFSVALVTKDLAEKIKKVCREEIKRECKENESGEKKDVKFELKHDVAALHAAAISQKEERDQVLTNIGPYRRALCARQDLQIRQKLCRFHHRLPDHLSSAINTTQQNNDPELYQMSVHLFRKATQKSEAVF